MIVNYPIVANFRSGEERMQGEICVAKKRLVSEFADARDLQGSDYSYLALERSEMSSWLFAKIKMGMYIIDCVERSSNGAVKVL